MKSPRGLSERSFGSAADEFSLLRFFSSWKRNEKPSRLERKSFRNVAGEFSLFRFFFSGKRNEEPSGFAKTFFSKKNRLNACRFKKKTYLCIAIEKQTYSMRDLK